ncbi:MAG: DUF29 domain-containing protein [Pseudanabaena sp. RU_4_16]|nr:DUF29 domain-containing protein [Pseudanabaena sp. RU_4_16]
MSAQLPKTSPRPSSVLYEQDYYLWIKNTAQLLQQDRLSEIDIANLIEEIEDIGKSEKRSVESNLEIVLMHLLKYKYQRSKISNSWLLTIFEHRKRLHRIFKDSPSLKVYVREIFNESYLAVSKSLSISFISKENKLYEL